VSLFIFVVSICIVNSFVLRVFFIEMVVIGMFVGICMMDNNEFILLRYFKGIGMLMIGSGVSVVSILGRVVVFFVLVMIICRLRSMVFCLYVIVSVGIWWVEMTLVS